MLGDGRAGLRLRPARRRALHARRPRGRAARAAGAGAAPARGAARARGAPARRGRCWSASRRCSAASRTSASAVLLVVAERVDAPRALGARLRRARGARRLRGAPQPARHRRLRAPRGDAPGRLARVRAPRRRSRSASARSCSCCARRSRRRRSSPDPGRPVTPAHVAETASDAARGADLVAHRRHRRRAALPTPWRSSRGWAPRARRRRRCSAPSRATSASSRACAREGGSRRRPSRCASSRPRRAATRPRRLRACLRALHDADERLKGRGELPAELALERLVLALASQARAAGRPG